VAAMEEFTFVDVGAGMGRAVLLASEMPFKAVVGVELNATLTGIARRNAAVWRKAGRAHAPIRIVCGDAVVPGVPLQSVWRDGDAAAGEELEKELCGPRG